MKKRIFSLLLALCMVLTMLPAVALAAGTFADVPAGEWYADEVEYVYANGLMKGTGDGTIFNPTGNVSRAMVWTTLARMDGADTNGSSPWYLAGQNWAMNNGVSDGTGAANDITREQLATMLFRYAQLKGYDVSVGENTNILSYTDAFQISQWAYAPLQWACGAGIINGSNGALNPQGSASRAELATMLYRFMENVVKAEPETVTYTVTFVYDADSGELYDIVEVTEGESVGKLANPTRKGYSFAGWYTEDGVRFTMNTKVTGDIVVYAKWSKASSSGGHTHNYRNWTSNEDGTHTGYCSCARPKTEDCTYAEGVCSKCGFVEGAVAMIGDIYYTTLDAAIATVTDSTPVEIVILKTGDTALTTNVDIAGGKNILFRGVTGNPADVKLAGQIATTSSTAGTLTIKDVTIFVDSTIVDSTGISQTSKSAIAVWGNQTVNCENVVFEMSLADSTAISGWWDTGVGTTINVKNCVFNCNGQRPLRSCGNMTVEGCTFNDPYRYAIQLTAKASTATELENAVVNFKNNTIVNGENGKAFVYGIQLEGGTYGCQNLIINGSGNTIVDGGDDSAMYYCECGKVDHSTITWNTEVPAVHEDLTPVAMIGGVEYGSFADAVAAVQNNETIVILKGTYTEILDVRGGKTFTVKAEEDKTVVLAGIGHESNANPSTVTFENLTINNSAAEGWFIGTSPNIAPCVGAWGGHLTFRNCTFKVAGTSGKETGVMTWWTGDNLMTLSFDKCTFNGVENHASARAMQIYGKVNMTVTGCEFNTKKDYTLKYVANEGCSATLSNNTVNNSENFVELGSSAYPGSKYTVYLNSNTLGSGVSNYVIANPENQTVYVDGVLQVSSAAALKAALDNATGTTTIALADGEYKMPSSATTANITITGSENAVIDLTWGAYLEKATLTFNGVAIKGSTGYVTSDGVTFGSDYAALYSKNVTYTDCTFSGPFRIGRDGATFTGCTFNNLGNDYIWTYGNAATFTGCTFNSDGKALLIYSDGNGITPAVSVTNCTFNATAGAKAGAIANQNCAAIEIDNYGCGVALTVSGNIVDEEFSGVWRIKSYYTGKEAVTVNNTEYTTIAIDGKTMTKDSSNNVTVQE